MAAAPATTAALTRRPASCPALAISDWAPRAPVPVHLESRRGLGRDVRGPVVTRDDFDVDVSPGESVGFKKFELRVGILHLAVLDGKVELGGGLLPLSVGRLLAAPENAPPRPGVDPGL